MKKEEKSGGETEKDRTRALKMEREEEGETFGIEKEGKSFLGEATNSVISFSSSLSSSSLPHQLSLRTPPPALLTQLPLTEEDQKMTETQKMILFPPGQKDPHNEPKDLRKDHTWTRNLTEISGVEMVEVQMINNVAPTLLLSRLFPRVGGGEGGGKGKDRGRFVINVTSPEGRFGGAKTNYHVHTNMAKSALNMLTHTMGGGMAGDGVYVNSVDTGWVSWMTNEGFYSFAAPKKGGEGEGGGEGVASCCCPSHSSPSCSCTSFPSFRSYDMLPSEMANHNTRLPLSRPPLSEEDGAARVLDPIFEGITQLKQGLTPQFGCLFCHFESVSWENSGSREWRGRERERREREKEREKVRKREKEEEEKKWKKEFGV